MGVEDSNRRLPDRVLSTTSEGRPHEGHTSSTPASTEKGPRVRDSGTTGKAGDLHRSSRGLTQPVQVVLFSDTKETRRLASNPKSKALEQEVYQSKTVQNGNSGFNHPKSHRRDVGVFGRLKGRVSSRSNQPRPPTVSGIQIQKHRLSVPCHALRALNRPKGLYPYHQGSLGSPQTQRYCPIRLSRRLASASKVIHRGGKGNRPCGSDTPKSGLGSQREEVVSNTVTGNSLPRGSSRSSERHGLSVRRKSRKPGGDNHSGIIQECPSSKNLAQVSRAYGQLGGGSTRLQVENETDSVPHSQSLFSSSRSPHQENSSVTGDNSFPHVVEGPSQPLHWKTIQRHQTSNVNGDRCIHDRLGSSVGSPLRSRSLEQPGGSSTHQCPGTEGSSQSHRSLEGPSSEPSSDCPLRQFNNSLLHQQTGRNQITQTVPRHMVTLAQVPATQHLFKSLPSGRSRQPNGRCPIQGSVGREGMGAIPGMGRSPVSDLRQTINRPLCQSSQCEASSLLHSLPSPTGVGNGRSLLPVGQPLDVCVSPVVPSPQGIAQVSGIHGGHVADCTLLAKTALVSSNHPAPGRQPVQTTISDPPSHTAVRSSVASGSEGSPSLCLDALHKRFEEAGISRKAADLAVHSRRPSTIGVYDSRLEKYLSWAATHGCDPLEASVDDVCSFLVSLFEEGKQVSTVRNYRSAVASVHRGFPDGSVIGTNPFISHLLKGMFNERPPVRKLAPSWSINDVLQCLSKPPYEPMQNAPLDALTHKTLFLVAAASARRRGEIHALSVKQGFLRFDPGGVFLLPDPTFLSKNQTVSFTPAAIFLPSMSASSSIREDRLVCPVRALKWYIEKTKSLRKSDALFILPRAPYSKASKDTLSRWLVSLISPHADAHERVRAHDVRAQATSLAWFKGIPLHDVMAAAAWKSPSSFVSNYLTDVVSTEGAFASSILSGSRHRDPGHPTMRRC